MSFTPVVRYRNFTVQNLKSLLEVYPDMAEKLSWDEAKDEVENITPGYKKTAYQLACQLGLEDRGREPFRIQSYLYSFDEDNLEKYLQYWLKVYYAPNPYVKAEEDEPMLIYCELAKEILSSQDLSVEYIDFFTRRIGGKSDDILLNAIKAYANPIKYKMVGSNNYLYINLADVKVLQNEIEFIQNEYPIISPKDRKVFFDRYAYDNFCKFFGIVNKFPGNENITSINTRVERIKGGNNILLYGVPGSGKSYTIEKDYCRDKSLMERVVFHPDYTYSDFVGQILPRVIKEEGETEGKLRYIFTPGPFTKMLIKAEENPGKMYYLVIEELNRGNAPAIFGDIFQLLDRDSDGTSIYGISSYDVASLVYNDAEHEVRFPSNISVLATMNTSDQNVFTLDTAFQRRWNMRLIENKIDNAEHADKPILDTTITWRTFNQTINEVVIENSMGVTSSEDKRLGAFFVKAEDIEYNQDVNSSDPLKKSQALKQNNRFPEKVIKYLWDDVFKYNRTDIFKDEYKSLEDVVYDFEHGKRFDVFKLKFYQKKLNDMNLDAVSLDVEKKNKE